MSSEWSEEDLRRSVLWTAASSGRDEGGWLVMVTDPMVEAGAEWMLREMHEGMSNQECAREILTAALDVLRRDPEVRERVIRVVIDAGRPVESMEGRYQWSVALADAVLSVLGEQESRTDEKCDACAGEGRIVTYDFRPGRTGRTICPTCSGSGRVLCDEGDRER